MASNSHCPWATPAITGFASDPCIRQEFHGKNGWASLRGLGAIPCDGMQQKEPFTKPGKALYFLFHLFSTAFLGVQCLPVWIWLSYIVSWGCTGG